MPNEKGIASIAENATVIGSGASVSAGTATTLAAVLGGCLSFPAWVVPSIGLGALVVGGIGAFYMKDWILQKAEQDAKSLGFEPSRDVGRKAA